MKSKMKSKKHLALGVPLSDAETIRAYLLNRKLLDPAYRITKNKTTVYFPVQQIPKDLERYTKTYRYFEEHQQKPTSYKQLLTLPAHLQEKLPTSYDIVGNIILMKIPEELQAFEQQIGAALLQSHKQVETVFSSEPVRGEFRLRNLHRIAGKQQTITLQKEYGLSFLVDVEKTYFSPRLASERRRIAGLVQPGEIVVDLFAGVAPFSCMIAQYAQPKMVYAVDKNRDAVELARRNIVLNKLADRVTVLHADAHDIPAMFLKTNQYADRIVMNLPFESHRFFPVALALLKKQGVIHMYTVADEENLQTKIEEVHQHAHQAQFLCTEINIRKIKTYATREFYIALDITATKMPT
ncbi:MAG: class I SAM-dependent methyltransferase family protein [Candidatus Thermoplasmatota archaeon]